MNSKNKQLSDYSLRYSRCIEKKSVTVHVTDIYATVPATPVIFKKKRVTVHVTDIYATVPVTPVIFLKKSVTVHVIDIYVVVLVLLQLKPQFNLNFCQVYTPLCHVAWPARPVPWWPSAPPELRVPHPYPAPAAPSPESASSA